MSQTDAATQQAAQEGALAAYLDAIPSLSDRATALVKIGIYRQDLAKQAPMLAQVDEDLAAAVVSEWFEAGDADLKRLVFNAGAGSEEIGLAKVAPLSDAELALEKLIADAGSPNARAHLLQKMGAYANQVSTLHLTTQGVAPERRAALVKSWLEADPGEAALKKNILDAGTGREGRRIYGDGIKTTDTVRTYFGNASTHAGQELQGSEHGTDQNIARTVPRAPKGAGAGRFPGGQNFPGQKDAAETDPGSGPNDGGGGEMRPAIRLRRKGTTGGLGSVSGAGPGADHDLPSQEDKGVGTAGRLSREDEKARKRRSARITHEAGSNRRVRKSADDVESGDATFEIAAALVKIAPDAMTEALIALDDDDQVAVLTEAAAHAADLMAWTDMVDPDALQKRDLDGAIEAWLTEDPDTIQLKKWVAEALATSEDIPLELGCEIMAWEPLGKVNWGEAARGAGRALRSAGRNAAEYAKEAGDGAKEGFKARVDMAGGGRAFAAQAAKTAAKKAAIGTAAGAGIGALRGGKPAKKHTVGHLGWGALFGPSAYGGYRAGRALVARD